MSWTIPSLSIQFPNPEGPHQAKSSVFITGSIDSVCLAREQLTVRTAPYLLINKK